MRGAREFVEKKLFSVVLSRPRGFDICVCVCVSVNSSDSSRQITKHSYCSEQSNQYNNEGKSRKRKLSIRLAGKQSANELGML